VKQQVLMEMSQVQLVPGEPMSMWSDLDDLARVKKVGRGRCRNAVDAVLVRIYPDLQPHLSQFYRGQEAPLRELLPPSLLDRVYLDLKRHLLSL